MDLIDRLRELLVWIPKLSGHLQSQGAQAMRITPCLGIGCLLLLAMAGGSVAEEVDPIVRTKLVGIWAAERRAVMTGHFRCYHLSLRDLRLIPIATDLPCETFSTERDSTGQIVIKAASANSISEFIVDEETGFVRRLAARTCEGRTRRIHLQSGPVTYPGGVVFSKVYTQISCYTNCEVSNLQIVIIDQASLNQPIKEDVFRVFVPSGTTVVDAIKNPGAQNVFRAKEDISDIAAFLKTK
jgi:hypothetical protein